MSNSYPFGFNTPVWPGLAKVQEESNELGTELAKLVMVGGRESDYWEGRPLRDNIRDEAADLLAALTYFVARNFSDAEQQMIYERIDRKIVQYVQWEREE